MSVVPEQRVLHGAIASEDVRLLQSALAEAGLEPGPVDGIYGYRTAAAVRRFQEKNELEPDGIVGQATWQRLGREKFGAPLRSRTPRGLLHGATSGEDVAQAQRTLAQAGFDPGEVDGVYGPQTARAVRRFQEENGIQADGIVGTTTWSALLPPRPGDAGTFERSPVLALVWSEADRQAVRPFEATASTFGLSWRSYVAEELELDALERWRDLVVVVFLSPALVSSPAVDVLVVRSTTAEIRIVPVLLAPVDLIDTSFAGLEILPADGTALSELDEPAGAFRQLLAPLLAAVPVSMLPGFSADAADGVALFGVGARVEFLASVLTAQSLETPLAIGLFGDWGSGKSFFMRRLQERVRFLSDRSAQAGERDEPTLYCSNIRQVTFNAWLYSDGDIWPSFAAQVFRSLTGAANDVAPAAAQAGHLGDYQKELRALEERRSEAESQESELKGRLSELESEIGEKQSEIDARAGDLGPEAGAVAKLMSDLGEVVRRLGRLGRDWRTVRASDALVLAVPVAVAVAAFFFDWARILALLAVIGTILAFVLASLRYVERTRLLRSQITDLEDEKEKLQGELETRKREREAAEKNLGAAAEFPLLPQFAEEQALRWLGRQQLGVVTEIRLAFERLSEMIEENRAAARAGADPQATLPIDRVIIYVDDLDRCPHDVVVRVLETIKVLLDLRHFVVVVGVDSRWLFRSIQVHFSELLHAEDGADPDAAWAATPQNYLEKIFQYSIVLRPLEQAGFAELIDSLFPVDGTVSRRPSAAAPDTPAEAGSDDRPDGSETEPRDVELEADDVESTPVAAIDGGAPAVDLMPGSLDVSREEVEFMKRLSPLFATPRAAKRLANVYRLVRVSAGGARLADPKDYEPVLLLLAVSIAYPGLAGDVFQAVRESASSSFSTFLQTLPPAADPPRSARETAQWERLLRALTAIGDAGPPDRDLQSFIQWLPIVAEFSFHPWQELLPAETRS